MRDRRSPSIYFAEAGAEFAVCEVGMGGRLDATNILLPEVAVITQIDFDHENYLGHSIEEIAAEKAGIIKPGARVVSAAEHLIARVVIRRRCAEQSRVSRGNRKRIFPGRRCRSRNGCFSFTAISTIPAFAFPSLCGFRAAFKSATPSPPRHGANARRTRRAHR